MEQKKEDLPNVTMPEIQLDVTPISEMVDQKKLLGFLDYQNKTVYVSNEASDRVKKVFHVKEDKGDTWSIVHSIIGGMYKIVPLSGLDFGQPVHLHDAVANEDELCYLFKKDSCVNFYKPDGIFDYSWKAEKAVYFCAWGEEDCGKTLLQTNDVMLYPEEDCKGTPEEKEKTWLYCVIN